MRNFAACADSQRAWLLLEDYFEKLSLSRKDFPSTDWWPRLLAAQGRPRLEEMAFLFLRAKRSLPTELAPYANLDRFAEVEQAAQEQQLVQRSGDLAFSAHAWPTWTRRAPRCACSASRSPTPEKPARHRLGVQFHLLRPRTGEKVKTLAGYHRIDHPGGARAGVVSTGRLGVHPVAGGDARGAARTARRAAGVVGPGIDALAGALGPGGAAGTGGGGGPQREFHGEVAELTPHLENGEARALLHAPADAAGREDPSAGRGAVFHAPAAAGAGGQHVLPAAQRAAAGVLEHWASQPAVPVRKLSHRLLMHLRKTQVEPRRGLGAALRGAPGAAAVRLRVAG